MMDATEAQQRYMDLFTLVRTKLGARPDETPNQVIQRFVAERDVMEDRLSSVATAFFRTQTVGPPRGCNHRFRMGHSKRGLVCGRCALVLEWEGYE